MGSNFSEEFLLLICTPCTPAACAHQGCISCAFISTLFCPPQVLPSDWSDQNVCRVIGRPIESCCHSRNISGLQCKLLRKTVSRKQRVQPDTDLNNFLWQQPTNPSTASDLDIFFFHSGTAAEMPDKNIESLLSAALAKVSSTDCATCS